MTDDRSWKTLPGKSGVLYREHPTRKYQRKPDRQFCIRHSVNGKRLQEMLGWASEGWTIDMAVDLVGELKRNAKTGDGPQSLAEKRAQRTATDEQVRRQAAQDAAKDITFRDMSAHYRQWAERNRASADDVARNLDLHLLPLIGGMKASEITPATVTSVKEVLLKKKPHSGRNATLSQQTVMHCLKTIREAYNHARETPHPEFPEMMLFHGQNPAIMRRSGRGLKAPKVDNRRLRILTDSEIASLLSYRAKTPEDTENLRGMMLLSLDTGIRSGELVRLRWEDVSLDTGALHIIQGSARGTTKSLSLIHI